VLLRHFQEETPTIKLFHIFVKTFENVEDVY